MKQPIYLDAIREREQAAALAILGLPHTVNSEVLRDSNNDIPALLDEIDRLNADIATLHKAIEIAQGENERLRGLVDRAQRERCDPTGCPHADTTVNLTRRGFSEREG